MFGNLIDEDSWQNLLSVNKMFVNIEWSVQYRLVAQLGLHAKQACKHVVVDKILSRYSRNCRSGGDADGQVVSLIRVQIRIE